MADLKQCHSNEPDKFIVRFDDNIKKALELLFRARLHQCFIYMGPLDELCWGGEGTLPNEFLDEVADHSAALVEYFQYTDRYIGHFFTRAFDGYLYCLNQMQKSFDAVSALSCYVPVLYWRSTIKTALQLSDAELNIIQGMLIHYELIKYLDDSNTLLTTSEQELINHSMNEDACADLNFLLTKPRQFVYC